MSIGKHVRKMVPVLLCAIAALAPTSVAQDKPAKTDDGVLAGPKVDDKPPAGGQDMMRPAGAGREGKRRALDVPFQQWMATLRGLGLTEDQQDRVRGIAGEFETAQHEYEKSLSEADRQAIQTIREAKKSGTEPPKELRETMKKIDSGRPNPGAYQERIWAVLTAEQQATMKVKLEELRAAKLERKGEGAPDRRDSMEDMNEGMRRDAAQTGPGAQPATPQPPRSADGRRAAESSGLDELGQRRLRFLLSRQSKDARQPGREPLPDERRFRFEEDQHQQPSGNRSATEPSPR